MIGPGRCGEQPHAGGVGHQVAVELVEVEASARLGQVIDGAVGGDPEREAYIPELEIEVNNGYLLTKPRERDGQVAGGQRLSGSALGAEHADQWCRGDAAARRPATASGHDLLDRELHAAGID